jgi:hypothetical protein
MRYYATLTEDLCTGVQSSPGPIESLIEITAEVQSGTTMGDFLWRKYDNGWGDKFEPVQPPQSPSLEERLQIAENALATLTNIAVNKGDLTPQEASGMLSIQEV